MDRYVDKYFEKNLNDQTKSHIFLNDIKLATVNNNDSPYYILTDHLNSSSILSDSTGTTAQLSDYKPFGEIVYNNTITDLKNDYKHTGKEADEENNLQYYGARYYDNKLGKFISVEPVMLVLYDGNKVKSISGQELKKILSDPQTLNTYAYSKNNPIILVDVDGNWWKELITGKQSLSSFQLELGQAANQLYNDSGTWKAAMDHPGYTGVVVGAGSGAVFAGASSILTPLSAQYLGGIGTGCVFNCQKVIENAPKIGQQINSLGTVIENASGKIEGFNHDGSFHGIDQVISRGVSPQTLLDTVNNPLVRFAGRFDRIGYLTREAYVVLDKNNQLVTVISKNEFLSTITNLLKTIK